MATTSDIQRYRFYADGSESGSAALAAQNADIYVDVSNGNVDLGVRFGIQETDASGNFGNAVNVEYRRNGGAWTALTTGTAGVRGFDSASLTDNGATTSRLTGGTGSFDAGKVIEDGASNSMSLSGSNRTEHLQTLRLIAADLRDGETLEFKAHQLGSVQVNTVIPKITVVKEPNQRFFFAFNQGFGR